MVITHDLSEFVQDSPLHFFTNSRIPLLYCLVSCFLLLVTIFLSQFRYWMSTTYFDKINYILLHREIINVFQKMRL